MGVSSPTKLQMKHVLYADVLEVIRVLKDKQDYVNAQHVCNEFPEIPEKIIRRKLEKLIDKRIIEGCACGCSTAIQVGLYEPLWVVVGIYDESKGGWRDELRPMNWRDIQKQRAERQRQQFMSEVLDKIKEDYERYN